MNKVKYFSAFALSVLLVLSVMAGALFFRAEAQGFTGTDDCRSVTDTENVTYENVMRPTQAIRDVRPSDPGIFAAPGENPDEPLNAVGVGNIIYNISGIDEVIVSIYHSPDFWAAGIANININHHLSFLYVINGEETLIPYETGFTIIESSKVIAQDPANEYHRCDLSLPIPYTAEQFIIRFCDTMGNPLLNYTSGGVSKVQFNACTDPMVLGSGKVGVATEDLTFEVVTQGETFSGVSGNNIGPEDYTYQDSVLTLKKDYLDTLPNGEYEFIASLENGYQIPFKVYIKRYVDVRRAYTDPCTGFEDAPEEATYVNIEHPDTAIRDYQPGDAGYFAKSGEIGEITYLLDRASTVIVSVMQTPAHWQGGLATANLDLEFEFSYTVSGQKTVITLAADALSNIQLAQTAEQFHRGDLTIAVPVNAESFGIRILSRATGGPLVPRENAAIEKVQVIAAADPAPEYPQATFDGTAPEDVTVALDLQYETFTEVRGNEITAEDYTFDAESKTLTIRKEYFSTLLSGSYTYTIVMGKSTASLPVLVNALPATPSRALEDDCTSIVRGPATASYRDIWIPDVDFLDYKAGGPGFFSQPGKAGEIWYSVDRPDYAEVDIYLSPVFWQSGIAAVNIELALTVYYISGGVEYRIASSEAESDTLWYPIDKQIAMDPSTQFHKCTMMIPLPHDIEKFGIKFCNTEGYPIADYQQAGVLGVRIFADEDTAVLGSTHVQFDSAIGGNIRFDLHTNGAVFSAVSGCGIGPDDYVIGESSVEIGEDFLSVLPNGQYTFLLENDHRNLTVNVQVVNSEKTFVTPAGQIYDGENPADVRFTVLMLGENLRSLTGNGIAADDYDLSSGELTIFSDYLYTLRNGDYTYILQTETREYRFTVTVENSQQVLTDPENFSFVGTAPEDLQMTLIAPKGGFTQITGNGISAEDYQYQEDTGRLVVYASFLSGLVDADYVFTVETEHGNGTFSVSVRESVAEFVPLAYSMDISAFPKNLPVEMDGEILTVYSGDAVITRDDWEAEGNTVVFRHDFLLTLTDGEYDFTVVEKDTQQIVRITITGGFADKLTYRDKHYTGESIVSTEDIVFTSVWIPDTDIYDYKAGDPVIYEMPSGNGSISIRLNTHRLVSFRINMAPVIWASGCIPEHISYMLRFYAISGETETEITFDNYTISEFELTPDAKTSYHKVRVNVPVSEGTEWLRVDFVPDYYGNVGIREIILSGGDKPLTIEKNAMQFDAQAPADLSVGVNLYSAAFGDVVGNDIYFTDYLYSDGVLTIRSEYLSSLKNGDYVFTLHTPEKEIEFTVTVLHSSVTDQPPETFPYAVVIGVSVAAVAVIIGVVIAVVLKKKKASSATKE